jgi:hypothetical protein
MSSPDHHFHIPLPRPSTFAHNLPHPHRSSTNPLPHPHAHIDTPHPISSTISYLDHIPTFAKHHQEYKVQHSFTAAKREARRSVGGTPIPELINEDLREEPEPQKRTAEEIARDQAEWEAICRAREAATRRNKIVAADAIRMSGETKFEAVVMVGRVDTAMTVSSEVMSGSEGSITPTRD